MFTGARGGRSPTPGLGLRDCPPLVGPSSVARWWPGVRVAPRSARPPRSGSAVLFLSHFLRRARSVILATPRSRCAAGVGPRVAHVSHGQRER